MKKKINFSFNKDDGSHESESIEIHLLIKTGADLNQVYSHSPILLL